MRKEKWTKERFVEHIKVKADYSNDVVMAAMYKKLYGEFPKIGLSWHQGSCAEFLIEVMPEPITSNNKTT